MHDLGFPGHAVADRHHRSRAEAHQREAERRRGHMGQENGDQQPGGDERAAGLQDTDDPEPGPSAMNLPQTIVHMYAI